MVLDLWFGYFWRRHGLCPQKRILAFKSGSLTEKGSENENRVAAAVNVPCHLKVVTLFCFISFAIVYIFIGSTVADTPWVNDILTFPLASINKTKVQWNLCQSLNVPGCTNISIVIDSDTTHCCNAVVLTNSSCGECSEQGLNQCFVNSEMTSCSFKEGTESSCANLTNFKIQCVECQPLYCPPSGTYFWLFK